jgi:hypothetical protein
MGIELGWADMLKIPIVCIYRKGCTISGSLKAITNTFIEYIDHTSLITQIEKIIKNIPKRYKKHK